MARFVKGDIVVVPFPFSDLTQAKRRPALVITTLKGDDIILCQITSQMVKSLHNASTGIVFLIVIADVTAMISGTDLPG